MSVSNFLIRTAKKVTSLNKTIENTAQIIFLSLLKKVFRMLVLFLGNNSTERKIYRNQILVAWRAEKHVYSFQRAYQ